MTYVTQPDGRDGVRAVAGADGLAIRRRGYLGPVTDIMPAAATPRPEPGAIDAADPIIAALDRIALAGFPARMEVARDHVRCGSCGSRLATKDVRWQMLEMISTLDAMHVVGGIRCPVCEARGGATTTLDLLRG